VHWFAAITFVILAITGFVILYGKNFLLPLLGHDAFAWVALASKWLHNVSGPLFVIASLIMFFVYWRDNRFERADVSWLLRGGGMFSHEHVPAPYFNAGEKLWFWGGVTLLGLLVGASGLVLLFPYAGEVGAVTAFTRYQLQAAQVLHLSAAAVYVAVGLGHIYLGTLGSPGAWRAMRHGEVDAAWARAHHRLWYDELQRRDGTAAPRRS
jgi:formate dehydrogenase subunit gamma